VKTPKTIEVNEPAVLAFFLKTSGRSRGGEEQTSARGELRKSRMHLEYGLAPFATRIWSRRRLYDAESSEVAGLRSERLGPKSGRQIFRGLVLLAMGSCEAFSPPFSRSPIEQRVERVLGLRLSSTVGGPGPAAQLKLIICQGSSCK
jgi:hypothetical protein